jgi:RNA polymerase sigma-70 factor (ECF subfamily)
MAVAPLLHQHQAPQPERLAPVIPLRPEQRMAADAARSQWATLVTDAYAEHRDMVFGEAQRILRDADMAEDVVQEVFSRLWRRPDSFDPQRGCLRAYLRTVARGRSIDLLRSEVNRRARQDRTAPTDDLDEGFEPGLVDAATVRASVDLLPAHERDVVTLAYLADRTYREVALQLGIPEGTVKTRMRSAFGRLRDTCTA